MNESNLEKIIANCFIKLKKEFYELYTIEEYEDDTNPSILSKRDVVESLPPPSIKIIEIINDSITSKHKKGFLFKYDYTPQTDNKIEFCGSVSVTDSQLIQFVHDKFDFKENKIKFMFETICKDFTDTTTWEHEKGWSLQFIAGDIVNDSKIFYEDWRRGVFSNYQCIPVLSEKFQRERFENFNKIYGLENDSILSLSEITKAAYKTDQFTPDVESLQQSIAHIQLIPHIPEAIKTTFKRVKKLFILGYFEYELFTIAEHYAYLAFESAIKFRYIQSLRGKATLTIPQKNLKRKIDNPSHFGIVNFCKDTSGWNVKSLLVNGKVFPYSGKKLLDWLEENHLIRKWEKDIFQAGLELRNSSSHQENTKISMPNANLLHVIANEINHIFHKEIK